MLFINLPPLLFPTLFAIVSLAVCPRATQRPSSFIFHRETEMGITKRKSSRFSRQHFEQSYFEAEERKEWQRARRGCARLRGCEAAITWRDTRRRTLGSSRKRPGCTESGLRHRAPKPVTTPRARPLCEIRENLRTRRDATRHEPLVWLLERAEYERPNWSIANWPPV